MTGYVIAFGLGFLACLAAISGIFWFDASTGGE